MKNKLVIFSGSGMSAESGISTFRDAGGLWERYRIEEVATPDAWRRNPELVQHFYNLRRKQIISAEPNNAHILIASLEKEYDVTVITQNIDDLHERAGSSNVVHLHGNIRMAKSSGPRQEEKYYPINGWELKMTDQCEDGYPLRPHVVWFGEKVSMLDPARRLVETADVLVVIGTSLQVYPAAGLIYAHAPATRCFLIDPHADELQVPPNFRIINRAAGEGMKELLEILKRKSDQN